MTATTVLIFVLGLGVGIIIGLIQQRLRETKLRQLLREITQYQPDNISLPLINRVRRETRRLQSQTYQLQQNLEKWQKLLTIAPIGYLQVDQENQLLWCNEKARELLKLDHWQPNQVRLLLKLVRSYELDQLIEKTRQTQEPQSKEWTFHLTQVPSNPSSLISQESFSKSIPLKGFSYPLCNEQVGVFLEDRQALVELSQRSDRLFSDLTHELRTPLTSIRLVSETLHSRLEPPESRWVEQMLQEANRLIRLVEDWLEISQLEKQPRQHLKREVFALNPLIESAWETLQPFAQQKQLKLSNEANPNIFIRADQARLTQVFLNLFDNAIKHSPFQGSIWVKVFFVTGSEQKNYPENVVQINIIDQGEGLSQTDILRVFDRLYRGNGSHENNNGYDVDAEFQPSGTGLGLSITQQIILAHGGSIKADNHPETGGAWFQIQLPNSFESSTD
ncbi:HAMP domain-containing histidine kinase [Euhalothece natronophila Z-M001]|uniref:histidine kinase n=1 Tax=Euhalothece natronophila Z-M001 TaxID=522448 RepID=A0A5B8NQ85_9CHRO|nr:PAS domain-containing sensor histidine kinase [Euhalothece natronophila]QDZ40701.1 HAMP domain-containing histidine kinase [Euhalothece natronophila Z-M001]